MDYQFNQDGRGCENEQTTVIVGPIESMKKIEP
jgi:hypothetical protein